MKIKLISPFKSIHDLAELDLPTFVILSGINGAGKTQLLQGISAKKIELEINGTTAKQIKAFARGLSEIYSQTFYVNKLENFAIALQNKIQNYAYHKKNNSTYQPNYDTFFTESEKSIIQQIKTKKNSTEEYIQYVDRMDIMTIAPPNLELPDPAKKELTNDVFSHDLSKAFKHYHMIQEQNNYNLFLIERRGRKNTTALNDDEFLAEHGEPPWIIANEIVKSADLNYTFTTPEGQGLTDPFTVKLIESSTNNEINFSDLSSGERVLMSLVLTLYNDEFDRIFPEVLLLDEPDCHLHPSMVGKLLKVIKDVFVDKRKVSVIITTHSPSTVALSADENLYVMSKDGKRLAKQSKDRCIKNLTYGIPSLSIDYDNRLQVFVESKYDAKNYSDIYEIIKSKLTDDFSLNFIPSGSGGSGSSDQVKQIVEVLRTNGNNKIYGIVDWDTSNNITDFIKVVAYQKRYSLENLILDPLIIGLYLLREAKVKNTDIGINSEVKYTQFANLSTEECKKISSYVISIVKNDLDNLNLTETEVSYLGGVSVGIETWYLTINGHELEQKIKNSFPSLKRFRNENDLKSEVIRKVMNDFPQFIPLDFFEIYQSISSQHLN